MQVEDFWQAEDVQISSAASTQYLPIGEHNAQLVLFGAVVCCLSCDVINDYVWCAVVGMSKSENSNHAEPEMPQPIVWH